MDKFDKLGFRLQPLPMRLASDRRRKTDDAWYYEDEFGLTIVHDAGTQFVIPRSQVMEYAAVATVLDRQKQ